MFERLVEIELLPADALGELAENRAAAIVEALIEAGVDRTRLASGGASEVEGGNGTIAAELALETGSPRRGRM
jgi:hypothetical protein